MATHLDKCREVFKERVLPSFPECAPRFDRYFSTSYQLLRVLPTVRHPLNPNTRQFDLELAFTLLGIKPATYPDTKVIDAFIQIHGTELLRLAGLEVIYQGASVHCIYDPVTTLEIARDLAGTAVTRKQLKQMLDALDKSTEIPHQLLGYPEPSITDSKGFHIETDFGLMVDSFGPGYTSDGFGFALSSPTIVLKKLLAYASAAALVEDIRMAPRTTVRRALINETLPHVNDIGTEEEIRLGMWGIVFTHDELQSLGVPVDLALHFAEKLKNRQDVSPVSISIVSRNSRQPGSW